MGLAVIGGYAHNVERIARADEFATAVVSLASDATSNISGAIVPVVNSWSAL